MADNEKGVEMQLVSPQEMQNAAIHYMLDDKPPLDELDWQKCVNFWASNAPEGLEEIFCWFMCMIFMPSVHSDMVNKICEFQRDLKEKARAARFN